jgi:pectate lyase
VVQVSGTLTGNFTIGSNKTIVGLSGATLKGHVQMSGSVNVIVQNLRIVGYNCTDAMPCQNGADAITVQSQAHHLWFDHLDVSDGSDGNLDMTHASDFITISFTKFHYSSKRTDPLDTGAAGHRFSNLIGHSDTNASEDTGHLKITFHHVWWADNVVERMPRVRFGQVHVFNSLYKSSDTPSGNDYCQGIGMAANVLNENDVFSGVKNPIDSTSFSDTATVVVSKNNLYSMTTGSTADKGGPAFTPPYPYALDPTNQVQAIVQAGAGPK